MAEAPAVLIIAGLDPSGGAGLIADVRVCELHGCRPVAVATALTEQTTVGLRAINPADPEVVGEQLRALLADVEVVAVKIGMLGSVAMAEQVARALELCAAPVIWDPVGRATRGLGVFDDAQLRAVATILGRDLALVTPNADEAQALSGVAIASTADAIAAGRAIVDGTGALAALVKGGHWGAAEAIDVLVTAGHEQLFTGARIALAEPVHGTGCALATAIACHLARSATIADACARAKAFVAARIAAPVRPGRGRPAVL